MFVNVDQMDRAVPICVLVQKICFNQPQVSPNKTLLNDTDCDESFTESSESE